MTLTTGYYNNTFFAGGSITGYTRNNTQIVANGTINKMNKQASGDFYASGEYNWISATGSVDMVNKTLDVNSESSKGSTSFHYDSVNGIDFYSDKPFFQAAITDGTGSITGPRGRTITLA